MDIRHIPLFSKIVDITLAVYRVTSFFPKNEPLREQIRDKVNTILAYSVKAFYMRETENARTRAEREGLFFSEVDILRGYFLVAKNQNWVKEINFEVLDAAYQGIKQEYKEYFERLAKSNASREDGEGDLKIRPPSVDISQKKAYNITNLPQRQKKIFEHIAKNGKIQTNDLVTVLAGANVRTIRRDLEALEKSGIIAKETKGRQIYFQVRKT